MTGSGSITKSVVGLLSDLKHAAKGGSSAPSYGAYPPQQYQAPNQGQYNAPQQWPPHNSPNPQQYPGPGYGQPPPQQYPQQYSGPPQQGYQPPPQPGPQGQPDPYGFPQYQQQQQPAFAQGAGPMATTLIFRETGKKSYQMVDAGTNQVLYTVNYSSSSSTGSLQVSRGEGGPPAGSAKFHSLSSKVDLDLGTGHVKFKKEFQSTTGQGYMKWRRESHGFLSSRGNLVLDSAGSPVATFRPEKGPDDSRRQGGTLEIHRQDLSPPQLDEIVISGVAELERRKAAAQSAAASSASNAAAGGAAAASSC
ncbi:hypothetical protein FALBO_8802 [Fusarium albosuccineum]|uniref:DUF6593 domain-containing protein n=1 Tax=Fusarium albosuccineum TaxID=1237068 RepID=A0A8H4LAX3_9HYPO|nr:hypothetical protein FALBO_8802 [Fusarium albosuccineum]